MWYCYKREYDGEPESPSLIMGRWYEQASPPKTEHGIPTAYLMVEGVEMRVHREDFIVRETKAGYSWAYENMGSGGPLEHGGPISFETLWAPVCPEGHRDPTTYTSPPAKHECSECGIEYPVQTEDSALVIDV